VQSENAGKPAIENRERLGQFRHTDGRSEGRNRNGEGNRYEEQHEVAMCARPQVSHGPLSLWHLSGSVVPYACQQCVERERPSQKTRLNVIAKYLHFADDGKGNPGLQGMTATGQGEFALEDRL
jgi:hypothetical protein